MSVPKQNKMQVWKSVLFALFLRELKSQSTDKLGLTWSFVTPFLFVFGLAYLRSLIREGDVHGVPVFLFMMIGLIVIQSFIQPLSKVSNAFSQNRPLYAFRQVQPISGLLVSGFVEYTIKFIVLILASLAIYLLEETFSINDPLLLIYLYHLLWIMTISLSCILGVCTAYVPEVKKLMTVLTRPLFFISCVFFSLQDIPREYWHWLTWNPLVHIIELCRYACFESYGDLGVNALYPSVCCLILFFFAVCLYHLNWKRVLSQ